MPDSLINNIMSFQTGICNCFPWDVYSKYKDVITPYKKYIDLLIIRLEKKIRVVLWGVINIYF